MGIDRLNLPKSVRDDMTADMGIDSYHGTPDHLNNDAIIPVYCVGKAGTSRNSPLHRGVFTDSIGQPAIPDPLFTNPKTFLIWGRDSGAAGMVPTTWYPAEEESYLAMRFIKQEFYFTQLGVNIITAYPSEIVCKLKLFPYPLNGSHYLHQWKWYPGTGMSPCPTQVGQGLIGEAHLNEVSGDDVGANGDTDKCSAQITVVAADPKGLILPPIGDWYFEWYLKGHNVGDPLIWPEGTSIKSTIMAELWKY